MIYYFKRWEEILEKDKKEIGFKKYRYSDDGFNIPEEDIMYKYNTPYEFKESNDINTYEDVITEHGTHLNKARFWTEEEYKKIQHDKEFNKKIDNFLKDNK